MRAAPAPLPGERPAARRAAFLALCLAVSAALWWLLWRALSPAGWSGWEMLIAALYAATLPWSAIGAANAAIGVALRVRHGEAASRLLVPQAAAPSGPPRPTALALCLRHEDAAAAIPPLDRLLSGLSAPGEREAIRLWILSDSDDPAHVAAEEAAVAALSAEHPGRVSYRRRERRAGYKAGNVMEFLENHAREAEFVVVLDADSEMSPGAVRRLLTALSADPDLALIQPLIAGRPAASAFPRLFQFGMRAGMRVWATGQGWWQLDDGPYWGHNAAFRAAPFREHGRLGPLPDGGAILSHDMVEAVRLRAAGWRVRCLPEEGGSLEANPPALPEFLARDERWAAGNMQYRHLVLSPGLRPMGRWQLLQAMLLFLCAPLWTLILLAVLANAATGGGAGTPTGALAALLLATWAANAAPRLAGYAELLLRPGAASPYGGRGAVLRGMAAEIPFSLLVEPVSTLNKALALARIALGRRGGWATQNRAARGVAWGDAARLLWPHTLLGVLGLLVLAATSATALLLGLPFLAGLALAVPLCVVTASPGFSAALARRGVAATPEERAGMAPG